MPVKPWASSTTALTLTMERCFSSLAAYFTVKMIKMIMKIMKMNKMVMNSWTNKGYSLTIVDS